MIWSHLHCLSSFSHTGLLSVLWTSQVCSELRAIALDVMSPWNALTQTVVCLPSVSSSLWVFTQKSPFQEDFYWSLKMAIFLLLWQSLFLCFFFLSLAIISNECYDILLSIISNTLLYINYFIQYNTIYFIKLLLISLYSLHWKFHKSRYFSSSHCCFQYWKHYLAYGRHLWVIYDMKEFYF